MPHTNLWLTWFKSIGAVILPARARLKDNIKEGIDNGNIEIPNNF